jgi:hypothetical protein
MSRHASVIVADDVTHSISGKLNIVGIYPTDIIIPTEPWHATQLVFLFIIETDPTDPYQSLTVYVELPGGESRHMALPIKTFIQGETDKLRWLVKYPLLFANPVLRAGPIFANVVHENGMIFTGAPVVVLRPPQALQTPAIITPEKQ